MKDINDQYADLSRQYSELLNDYQDIREDTKLLDWVETNKGSINCIGGWYLKTTENSDGTENEEWLCLPWYASARGTSGPPCATLREAIESLRTALDA
jgi:hypothetical protein